MEKSMFKLNLVLKPVTRSIIVNDLWNWEKIALFIFMLAQSTYITWGKCCYFHVNLLNKQTQIAQCLSSIKKQCIVYFWIIFAVQMSLHSLFITNKIQCIFYLDHLKNYDLYRNVGVDVFVDNCIIYHNQKRSFNSNLYFSVL